jgi:hypothetical protein
VPAIAMRRLAGLVILLLVPSLPGAARAQGLPEMAPINPVSSSRSGLYFQPLREPAPGRWITAVALDYASAVEYNQEPAANYILDSELMRLNLGLSRDLGSGTFLKLDASVAGAYAGFMDGFLDWYHGLLGIRMDARERRPKDQFLYEITLPGGRTIQRSRSNLFLQDTRVGLGYHLTPMLQSVLSVTLPTSTGPVGYGRGVPSVSVLNTLSTPLNPRVYYEGSAGVGYTPRYGVLKELQSQVFLALTSGVRVAVWGRQSLFANLFYHSPYYRGTTLPSLDRRELSLDFGWIVHTQTSGEWRIGMTEDLEPGGPGIDLIFRFGRVF